MIDKKKSLLLIIILFLGFFLRGYGLGDESFWIDEAATVYTLQQKPSDIIGDIYATTTVAPEYYERSGQSPFHYVISNYWNQLVGLSETRLRFLSVIFGVISIYVIFLIGKMIFDYKAGLISAFLLSVNYLHIWYSQEARPYGLGVLLTLLTVYFILNALKKQNALYWVAYVLSCTLLIYTHIFGFFILIFEYLFLLIFWKEYRESLKSIIISGISIFVLYIPWIPAVLRQMDGSGYLTNYLGQNIPYDFARIFVQFNSWFAPDLQTRIALRAVYHSIGDYTKLNLSSVTALGWLTIISVLLLTVLLGWYFVKSLLIKNKKIVVDKIKDKKYIFLLMWFLVPILIPIVMTLIVPTSPLFGFVNYVLFASPAYYLIVSKGIVESKKYRTILVLVVVLSLLPLYSHYTNFDKQQWRETAEYLKTNRAVDEIVVVNKANLILALGHYYKAKNIVGIDNVAEFIAHISKKDSFWFVYAAEKYGDPKGELKNYLDKNYKIIERTEFTGVKIFHYVKNFS